MSLSATRTNSRRVLSLGAESGDFESGATADLEGANDRTDAGRPKQRLKIAMELSLSFGYSDSNAISMILRVEQSFGQFHRHFNDTSLFSHPHLLPHDIYLTRP